MDVIGDYQRDIQWMTDEEAAEVCLKRILASFPRLRAHIEGEWKRGIKISKKERNLMILRALQALRYEFCFKDRVIEQLKQKEDNLRQIEMKFH
jgi:hypothetical protein